MTTRGPAAPPPAPAAVVGRRGAPLRGCVAVLSGFLRGALTRLGADVADAWGPSATHLVRAPTPSCVVCVVCAYPNTPKRAAAEAADEAAYAVPHGDDGWGVVGE
eukprot:gene19708-30837_t